MPIKFRCPHCEQFLGISRIKAGAVTDCPTCGRTIRVPDLDGKIAPLPKPELNYADSVLAKALDELAHLGGGGAEGQPGAKHDPSHAPRPEVIALAPAPVVEAISLPIPLPPEPMPHLGPSDGKPKPGMETRAIKQDDDSLWGPLEELAALPSLPPREAAPVKHTLANPRVVGVACACLGLAVGFWLGRLTGSRSSTSAPPIAAQQPVVPVADPAVAAPVPQVAEQGNPPENAVPVGDLKRAIEGRVTYINADGENRPDAGARILIVPATREGATKLGVDHFRSGVSASDMRVAQASIRALGGDFTVSGDDGQYVTHLPSYGKYQLLMVSRHQGRGPKEESDPAGIVVLKEWFDKPQLFFGQTVSTLTTVQFDGQASSIRDHVFPKAN